MAGRGSVDRCRALQPCEKLVIVGVGADEEPDNEVIAVAADRTVVVVDPYRPDVFVWG